MRSDSDDRRDDDVKRDLYGKARRMGYEPVLAIDDNPTVVGLSGVLSASPSLSFPAGTIRTTTPQVQAMSSPHEG